MKALIDLHTHTIVSGHAYSTVKENRVFLHVRQQSSNGGEPADKFRISSSGIWWRRCRTAIQRSLQRLHRPPVAGRSSRYDLADRLYFHK